jgi:hypothetical protein
MAINVRNKGASGEREFCDWLSINFPELESNGIKPKRNLEQVRNGGADIINVPCFKFEIKRCASIKLFDWWSQVMKSEGDGIPVVAYRQNNKDWNFLIPAALIGVSRGYMIVNSNVFKQYVKNKFDEFFS